MALAGMGAGHENGSDLVGLGVGHGRASVMLKAILIGIALGWIVSEGIRAIIYLAQ